MDAPFLELVEAAPITAGKHDVCIPRIIRPQMKVDCVTVGKDIGADATLIAPLHDTHISREQAVIMYDGTGQIAVSDTRSRQGTFINGQMKRGVTVLQIGDRVTFGGKKKLPDGQINPFAYLVRGENTPPIRERKSAPAPGECAVCFRDRNTPSAFACGHVFCGQCAQKVKPNCPICRSCSNPIQLFL